MDIITESLKYIDSKFGKQQVIQVGAMDGVSFDDIRGHLENFKWDEILVEPIPEVFEKLKNNLKHRQNCIFENSAIVNKSGKVKMITVNEETIKTNNLHPGYEGMSALFPLKNGFGTDYERDIFVRDNLATIVEVNGITLDYLILKHKLSKIDIFLVDAEGHDWMIFEQLNLDKFKPKFIRLEYQNLTSEEKEKVKNKLKKYDYYFEEGFDITAIENKLYKNLVNDVSNNIPGLTEIIKKYGSDKFLSGYDHYYKRLFKNFIGKNINYLEIGLGTLNPEIPSTFVGIISHYSHYQPSAILKIWREYFKNGNIFGIDVAEDCMLEDEDMITTEIVDSTNKNETEGLFDGTMYDIILDDGLHTTDAQLKTFYNFFDKVKENGLYVIEDIGGGDDKNLFADYFENIEPYIKEHEYFYGGNILIIFKNKSSNGQINMNDMEKNIDKINLLTDIKKPNKDLTIVTGLWSIGRPGRSFEHYIEHFKNVLQIPQNLFIYVPKELESLVWEYRDKENTFVKIYELEDVKHLYGPFWDKTQHIRNSSDWKNLAGWLPNSPQASLEWYNPIVQSKMFMLNDASIWNPFDTDYFFWLDAGITNTVPKTHLVDENILDKLIDHSNPFLFLSYPYQANNEIHGFKFKDMNRFSGEEVKYVCRGGLFGGHKNQLHEANATYYSLLDNTLNQGLMGTEESLFTIMSYHSPEIYRRYELDGNGLIVKFTENLIKNDIKLVDINKPAKTNPKKYTDKDVNNLKTNLYILTFNFPEQLQHTISAMEKNPEWLEKPNIYVLDNSTDEIPREENRKICNTHGFEYVNLGKNTGICGGRQSAAEHFDNSDADFMIFFEDDMTVNPPEHKGQFCRNGFRKFIPNLYNIIHKIMIKDKFDFLKLSFTEVYFDNDKQCSWYNVPQHIRTRDWPHYSKLPIKGLDPNVPLTEFKNIRNMDGVTYIDGEIYYANWPMIVSKEGNKKMFIDTKWGHPFEQTWMSHMYQMTKNNELNPAILLASPIWHDRIKHYKPNERREN